MPGKKTISTLIALGTVAAGATTALALEIYHRPIEIADTY